MTIQPDEIKEYCYLCDALVYVIPNYYADHVTWECPYCGRVIDSEVDYDEHS